LDRSAAPYESTTELAAGPKVGSRPGLVAVQLVGQAPEQVQRPVLEPLPMEASQFAEPEFAEPEPAEPEPAEPEPAEPEPAEPEPAAGQVGESIVAARVLALAAGPEGSIVVAGEASTGPQQEAPEA
jgi:hypothetical protein